MDDTGMAGMDRRSALRAGLVAVASAMGAGGLSGCASWSANQKAAGAPALLTVDASKLQAVMSSGLTGINANTWYDDEHGLWDSQNNRPNLEVMPKLERAGLGLLRYPGGTAANLFHWQRAIGPQRQRGSQVNGGGGAEPQDSRFGPDEFMRVMEQLGAEPQIMADFAGSTPQEIADWVAYMNAPLGTVWGDMRAANGHPKPYGVLRWEIGNEIGNRGHQRYWLSGDDATALNQYVFGGTQRQQRQPLGTPSDHRESASVSTGAANQQFTVWYPPVVAGSCTVYVNGQAWREVGNLSSAAGNGQVYTVDPATGTVRFGDGSHGAIPPKGGTLTADYDSGPHSGFVDYYAAIKNVDPRVQIYAVWSPMARGTLTGTSFPQFMAAHGVADKYDGVSIHPYTNFSRDLGAKSFPSRIDGHHYQMLGEAAATKAVRELAADVHQHAKGQARVAVTECGALWFGQHGHDQPAKAYPEYCYAMSHVLYLASQWADYANLGLPWVVGNALMAESPGLTRSMLGSAPDYVYSADAVAREQVKEMVHGGGHVVRNSLRDNPTVTTDTTTALGSSYPALASTASLDEHGVLNVLVVNRDPHQDVPGRVSFTGIAAPGKVQASTVSGDAYDSYNDSKNLDAVRIVQAEHTFQGRTLAWTFPAHSVVLLRFGGAAQ